MKRLILIGLVIGIAALIGCAPNTTPSPATTPIVSPAITAPAITATPTQSPIANNAATTPAPTGGEGLGTIPDFKVGTAVMMTDLPLISNAFEQKYKDYEVVGVTHALHENEQLYRIEYKDTSGKVEEAFIRPSGAWFDDTAPAASVE